MKIKGRERDRKCAAAAREFDKYQSDRVTRLAGTQLRGATDRASCSPLVGDGPVRDAHDM